MSDTQGENVSEQAPQSEDVRLTQLSYKATIFQQAAWEVIGEINEDYSFEPVNIEVLSTNKFETDPMFADFNDSSTPQPGVRRWKAQQKMPAQEAESNVKLLSEEEVTRLCKEAEERGKTTALEEAKQVREQEISSMQQRFDALLEELKKDLTASCETIEKSALQLTVDIARKIIDQAVEINPEYIVEIIKQALSFAGSASIKKVKVNPQDLEFIEVMGIAKKLKEFDGTWNFEADDQIKAGCLVETSAGEVDFDLNKAWERIATAVVKVVK